jgi:hypothetical protein
LGGGHTVETELCLCGYALLFLVHTPSPRPKGGSHLFELRLKGSCHKTEFYMKDNFIEVKSTNFILVIVKKVIAEHLGKTNPSRNECFVIMYA